MKRRSFTAGVWEFPPPRIKPGAGASLPHKGGGTASRKGLWTLAIVKGWSASFGKRHVKGLSTGPLPLVGTVRVGGIPTLAVVHTTGAL